MTDCLPVSSHTADFPFITKNTLYELIPDKYDLTPGTEITVNCVSGFRLVGESTFSCGTDGQWDYAVKPYCTDEAVTVADVDGTTTMMIAVVCGIAALIVITLILMLVSIWYRDRRRRRERREFWERIRQDRQSPEYRRQRLFAMFGKDNRYRDERGGNYGPSTIDMEMYERTSRVPPPPPYDSGYRPGDRDLDRGSRLSNPYRLSNPSQLSNPVYLPHDNDYRRPEHATYYGDGERSKRAKSFGDLSDNEKKPYVRDWVTRSSMIGMDDYNQSRPSVHGSRLGGDAHLWRQSNY